MVMTSRTYTTPFPSTATLTNTGALVRLPLLVVPQYETRCQVTGAIVPTSNKPLFRANLWSSDVHERFLHGLELFPNGPWKEVTKIVGTKSTRQTMTHAQKYSQKIERRMRANLREPKEMSTSRRRAANAPTAEAPANHDSTGTAYHPLTQSNISTMSMVDGLLSCNSMEAQESVQVAASRSHIYSDSYDTSFLDQEFDLILASWDSALRCQEHAADAYFTKMESLSLYGQAW